MGTTPNLGLRYPEETDIPDVATDIKELALDVDSAVSAAPGTPLGAYLEWPWAASQIPTWSLLPYNQLLTAAAYPALQAIADGAGRPYGGSAGVNFNMPDKRGRVSVGKDDMGGTAANRITTAVSGADGKTLGAVFGAEGITLTTAHLPAHAHAHTLVLPTHAHAHSLTLPAHAHNAIGTTNSPAGDNGSIGVQGSGYSSNQWAAISNNTSSPAIAGAVGNNSSAPAISGSISNSTGGDGAHQNTQPSIIVNVFMRVT
jgi:microcystin-dependent protein